MNIRTRRVLALLGAAALAAPSVAAAAPGHGKGHGKLRAKAKKTKPVTYVLKGTVDAEAGSVTVASGNSHARRGGLVGEVVLFDFTRAKVTVADTNGDSQATFADVKTGDKVLVQVRLPRREPGEGPYVARKVVDFTNPPVEDGDEVEVEGTGAGTEPAA